MIIPYFYNLSIFQKYLLKPNLALIDVFSGLNPVLVMPTSKYVIVLE